MCQFLLVPETIRIFEIPIFDVLTAANCLARLFGAMPLMLSLAIVRTKLLVTSPAGSLAASSDHRYHPLQRKDNDKRAYEKGTARLIQIFTVFTKERKDYRH